MEGENGVPRSIIDELRSFDIQRDQRKGERGVIRSILDEIHTCDIQGDQIEAKSMLLLKVASMNLILGMAKEIKR